MSIRRQHKKMAQPNWRCPGRGVCRGVVAAFLIASLSACGPSTSSAVSELEIRNIQTSNGDARGDWSSYLGDKGSSQYSPLAAINRDNVHALREAWRYDAGGAAANGSTQMQTNPLIVSGILYGLSPAKHVFALDAATGRELWRYTPAGLDHAFRGRGLVYWQGDAGQGPRPQRLLVGIGNSLCSLDAVSGEPDVEFGEDGCVDLRRNLDRPYKNVARAAAATPGVLYGDLLIQGVSVDEIAGGAPGYVRAYHVPSGELRWTFRTIPKPGDFGSDTWPAGAAGLFGGANAWAGISLDADRGLAFVPTGAPAYDFYGGQRPGDNLFANSLVALDAATGMRVWHYQIVRHDLWDRDLPSPPNLITLQRNGQLIPAVSQATKSGHLFVFHRETGEPLFPIEEVAVTGLAVDGEKPALSQPQPMLPPAFSAQHFVASTRNAAVSQGVQARLAQLRYGEPWLLPSAEGTVIYPGMDGGAEWGGQAWDEDTGFLYVNSSQVPYVLRMVPVPQGGSAISPWGAYVMVCSGCHGVDRKGDGAGVPSLRAIGERYWPWEVYDIIRQGRGRMPSFADLPRAVALATSLYLYTAPDSSEALPAQTSGSGEFVNAGWSRLVDHEGLPASQPPWGLLSAIDLNQGRIAWQIPLGDMPAILATGVSGLGAENYGGPVVTAGGLLFIAATPDRLLRAYDKRTGELLWQAQLPAAGFATPSVYEADGRQFLVIAAGGGKLGQASGSSYIAFALP